MIVVNALSISEVVANLLLNHKKSIIGFVHSVFARTVNVNFVSCPVGITQFSNGNGPYNILLSPEHNLSFNHLLTQNTKVILYAGVLQFSDKIIVNLNNALLWNPASTKQKSVIITQNILNHFIQIIVANLPETMLFFAITDSYYQAPGQISTSHVVINRVHQFRIAVQNHNNDMINTSIELLIGCGNGLTPLGDDFICGFLVTLLYAQKASTISTVLSSLINKISQNLARYYKKTTWASQIMISAAINGWMNEHTMEIITMIFSGQQIKQDNVLKVIGIGHTSGMAMLAGIYDALFIIYRDQNIGYYDK